MNKIGWGGLSQEEVSAALSLFNTSIRDFQSDVPTAIRGCICPLCNGGITIGAWGKESATIDPATLHCSLPTKAMPIVMPLERGVCTSSFPQISKRSSRAISRVVGGLPLTPSIRSTPHFPSPYIANSKTLMDTPLS